MTTLKTARTTPTMAASAILALTLAACSTSAWNLRPEAEIPELAARRTAGAALPSKVHRVAVPAPAVTPGTPPATAGIVVEHLGTGRHERGIVLVHGMFGNRSMWRYCTAELAQDAELYLVDLPGCGDSDKPDPSVVGDAFYSPTRLAGAVCAALAPVLSAPGAPRRLTLMGHSLGGMVALRMLGDPDLKCRHAAMLDRIERAVLLAPADVAIEKTYPDFKAIAELTDVEAALGGVLGVLAARVFESVYEGIADASRRPRELAEQGLAVLANGDTRHAAQAMIRQAIPFRTNGHPDWPAIRALEAQYANVRVPCLLVWGRCDETLPISMGYKLSAQLPDARLRILPDASHMLPFDAPAACVALARAFHTAEGVGALAVREMGEQVATASETLPARAAQ